MRSNLPRGGLYDGISDSRRPFHNANSKDGQATITGDIPKPIRKIPFPLTAQARNPMGWNVIQNRSRQRDSLQKFQPVELPVYVGRVLPHLELSQPNETACSVVDLLVEQSIKAGAHRAVQTDRNLSVSPPFGGNQRVGAMSFYN